MNWHQLNIQDLCKELFMFTSRPNSVQRACFYCPHFQKNPYQPIRKVVSLPISKTDDEWFFSKADFDMLSQNEAKEFFSPNFLKEYISRGETYLSTWLSICEKVHSTFSSETDNQARATILKEYFNYPTLDNSYVYFSLSVWAFDQKVVPVYIEELKKYFGDEFQKNWEIITSQTKLTEDQEMRIELAQLKHKHGENVSESEIATFQNKYRYLGIYSPEDYGFTVETIKKMYSEMDVEKTLEIQKHVEHNKAAFDNTRSKIQNEKILQMIDQINYNVYFRTSRSERISYGLALITPIYDYLIKNLSFSREEVGNLTNNEIVAYFEESTVPPKRDTRPALYFEDGNPQILTDEQVKELKSILDLKDSVQSFNGSIAYKGIARGKAKIITSVNDLPKVEVGDILVSQFTRPEYLSAMQRAAAFVTNDGGITCHAAIVARELKKPCIVGTKIATKVLKDGDVVEVDAEKGMVTIIK